MGRKKKKKHINVEFVTFEKINNMTQKEQVKFIIEKIKNKKILIFDSRLNPEEEAKLISETMKKINKKFTGIEICSLDGQFQNDNFGERIKNFFFKILTGKNRGVSIIGPAKIIKNIKRNPDNITIQMK